MEWNIIIGTVCAVLGVVFTYIALSKDKSKDYKGEGQQTGVVLTELGYIKSSVDTINKKMDAQDERNVEIYSRLTAVETSAKQAHKRIDRMEALRDHEHPHPKEEGN